MQTGDISFCDSTAFNIKSENVKKNILNIIESLTGIKIIQKHFNNFTCYAWAKPMSLPLLIEKGFNQGDTCVYVEKKIAK